MEMVMHVRSAMIAAAALATSPVALAQPPKAPTTSSAQAARHSSPVVLASAERVVGTVPQADVRSDQAKRPRAARVTSCRCGDIQPQADEQEQQ
jgi:hypothetical protein